MPEMVALERFFCRSGPWRFWTRRYVMPWALQGRRPSGRGLEIGAGMGLMAEAMLSAFPDLSLTVTDFDDVMLSSGRSRLERFGERADLQVADATGLTFPDDTFDHAFSFIMLHHVIEWEKALAETLRVLKPGGELIGYDILDTRTFRIAHKLERARVRPMTVPELHAALEGLDVDRAILTRGRGPLLRFALRKREPTKGP